MRLTCPSCASEYDVDAAAIGNRGRMVRCANCDAEWFQAPDAGEIAAAPPPPPAPDPIPQPETIPQPDPIPRPDPVPEARSFAEEPEVVVSETPEFDPAPSVFPDPEPVVQEAREDFAERLSPPARMTTDNVERIYYDVEPAAAPRFDETDVVEETRVRRRKEESRDDLAASLHEVDDDRTNRTGGAFLAGFSTVAVMAVILIALYVKAPDLAKVAPAMEGPLAGYTEMVNQGRFALASATQ